MLSTIDVVHNGSAVANVYTDGEIVCGACQQTIGFSIAGPRFADGISTRNRHHDDAYRAAGSHHESCPAR